MRKYYPRIADEVLRSKLEAKGAVLIEGPKWCGKSTTAAQAARNRYTYRDPSTREQNMMLAKASPKRFLQGDAPKLIDEWQVVPSIWDAVRFEVDQRDEFGQFILTGSVTPPASDEIAHSGTGRITRMRMRPMTLFESGDSNGAVSLAELFDGESEVFGGNLSFAGGFGFRFVPGRMAQGDRLQGVGCACAGYRLLRRSCQHGFLENRRRAQKQGARLQVFALLRTAFGNRGNLHYHQVRYAGQRDRVAQRGHHFVLR